MARGIELLTPKTQELCKKLVTECEKKGIKIKILDTYRSNAEQDMLYAKGRTTPGAKVTNAKGGQSFHNYKIAFDFCILDVKGGILWDSPKYDAVGEIGAKLGLTWGGNFHSIKDRPHFQNDDDGKITLGMLQKNEKKAVEK